MKRVLGSVILIVLLGITYFLNKPIGDKPAIGKLLSPTHGFWQNTLVNDKTNYAEELECINGKATIIIDSFDIPHIFADNEEDLYYAQGYVQAKYRLWQMEFQTLYAEGRISEIVGEKAIDLDKFNRRIGMAVAAKESLRALDNDATSSLVANAFSKGVNAYIKQLNKRNLPVEYKLMGYTPQEWSPYRSALLMKYMAYDLTYATFDIEYTNALNLFGEAIFKVLYPEFPYPEDPIIPINTTWNFKTVDSFKTHNKVASTYTNPFPDFLPKKYLGSNNWAVSGTLTKSGKPILCNDPHLGLNLPSIWFAMQLHCKDLNVMGVTIPGAPGIIIGHNDSIAWGVTNASRDVVSTFSVQYKDDKRTSYLLGNQYQPITYQVETIKVKGKKPIIDSIKRTIVGNIVYDENFGKVADKQHLAVYWRAWEPSNELMTFYKLNHSKNHADYLEALNSFGCPGQNFVYADVQNNIAIKEQGHFMLRSDAYDGSLITPLANVNLQQLKSAIPNNQNPYTLNPKRGFVSSANQKPVDKNYPYSTNGQYENYRNRVINTELATMKQITPKNMMQLQGNNLSLLAKETLPTMLYYLDETQYTSSTAKKIIQSLKNWEYMTNYSSTAPSYFYKWFEEIERLTWDEFSSKKVSLVIPENYVLSQLITTQPKFVLFDYKQSDSIETAEDIINMAFHKAMNYFEEKNAITWQSYKNTTVLHLAQISSFSVANVPIGGWHNIVNACSDRWGPSWRMIVDFANGNPKCYAIYPGGQNGNPASKFYSNMIPIWASNNYFELLYFKTKNDAISYTKN